MAVEAGSARPIEGAFVSLVDEAGRAAASTLTSGSGAFVLHGFPAGRYRLRVERIGYETWSSEPFLAGPGRTVTRRLEVPVQAVSLAGLEVEVASRCGSRSHGGPELARVWKEARKALVVARWTQGQRLIQYDTRTWKRQLDYTNIRVLRERGQRTKRAGRAAFVSRPGEELLVKGYVRPGAGKDYVYYAPDAEVLLSDLFQNAHCFSLARGEGERDGEIGLRFRPAERGRVPDVSGVLWLDETTAELRDVEFQYVDLDLVDLPRGVRAYGRVEFRRLPTGAWFVRRWWIRMPMLEEHRVRTRRELRAYAYKEDGGEVVQLVDVPSQKTQKLAVWGTVEGLVYDSLRGQPLADTEVYLVGTEYAAHTDAQGRYRLAEVLPGEYTMGFLTADETLFEGTLEAPVVSVREGATVHVELGVPSEHTLLSRLCPVDGEARVSDRVPPAVALGFVRDAATGEAVAGARVWFLSSESALRERSISERWERRGVVTDEFGAYRACGLPGDRQVVAQAETGEAASDTVWARTPRGSLLRLDMAVTRGKRAAGHFGLGGQRVAGRREKLEPPTDEKRAEPAGGTSTLLGIVRSAETDRPLEGARVSLPGLGVADVTDGHGRFRLPKLPAGRYRLAAEYLGFSSDTVVVELKPAGGAYVKLALQTEPIPLPNLEVEVARPLSRKLVGFYDRMKKGLGDFITKEDLERRDVVSNFRRIPNVRVDQCINPTNGLRVGRCWEVRLKRGYAGIGRSDQCKPVIYLDGHLLTFFGGASDPVSLNPFNVIQTYSGDLLEGIEVYRNAAMAPAQYRILGDACGIIMVWTKGRSSR